MKLDNHDDFFINEEEVKQTTTDTDATPGGEGPRRAPKPAFSWKVVALILGAILAAIAYVMYGTPYVEDAKASGRIVMLQREGALFKTYEGILEETDPSGRYPGSSFIRNLSFSATDDKVVETLLHAEETGEPVVIHYKSYYGTLPWRGASCNIITAAKPGNLPNADEPHDESTIRVRP